MHGLWAGITESGPTQSSIHGTSQVDNSLNIDVVKVILELPNVLGIHCSHKHTRPFKQTLVREKVRAAYYARDWGDLFHSHSETERSEALTGTTQLATPGQNLRPIISTA